MDQSSSLSAHVKISVELSSTELVLDRRQDLMRYAPSLRTHKPPSGLRNDDRRYLIALKMRNWKHSLGLHLCLGLEVSAVAHHPSISYCLSMVDRLLALYHWLE